MSSFLHRYGEYMVTVVVVTVVVVTDPTVTTVTRAACQEE
jgi:hypothetical protein